MTLEADIAEIPQFKRGIVWCKTCEREQRVNAVSATLGAGWLKCCGYTMTIDSPEEQRKFQSADQ
jgi:hypothetical protein